jgi:hypothetical protein
MQVKNVHFIQSSIKIRYIFTILYLKCEIIYFAINLSSDFLQGSNIDKIMLKFFVVSVALHETETILLSKGN